MRFRSGPWYVCNPNPIKKKRVEVTGEVIEVTGEVAWTGEVSEQG